MLNVKYRWIVLNYYYEHRKRAHDRDACGMWKELKAKKKPRISMDINGFRWTIREGWRVGRGGFFPFSRPNTTVDRHMSVCVYKCSLFIYINIIKRIRIQFCLRVPIDSLVGMNLWLRINHSQSSLRIAVGDVRPFVVWVIRFFFFQILIFPNAVLSFLEFSFLFFLSRLVVRYVAMSRLCSCVLHLISRFDISIYWKLLARAYFVVPISWWHKCSLYARCISHEILLLLFFCFFFSVFVTFFNGFYFVFCVSILVWFACTGLLSAFYKCFCITIHRLIYCKYFWTWSSRLGAKRKIRRATT